MCFCATSVATELSAAVATTSSAICSLFIADSQLLQRRIRTAVPLVEERVALVLQILDPHLRRPEATGGEIAEAAEERYDLMEATIRVRRVGDLVEDGVALCIGQGGEPLVITLLAQAIDERQASAHRHLSRRRVHHHEIHELG